MVKLGFAEAAIDRARLLGCACLGSLSSFACAAEPTEADLYFEETVRPLFEERCREGCHEPDGFNGELYLGEGFGQDTLVNVPSSQASLDLVEPGDLEKSYLWHKLSGTHDEVGGTGEPMPYATWPLPEEELDVVRKYILLLEP